MSKDARKNRKQDRTFQPGWFGGRLHDPVYNQPSVIKALERRVAETARARELAAAIAERNL